MKANKYAKLLSDSTAANSTVKFHELQITEYAKKCTVYCNDLNNKIEHLKTNAESLGNDPSILHKDQIEQLHQFQRELEQQQKNLHKDIEKPALQFLKELNKIAKDLNERILVAVNACTQPCEFDLNLIKTTVQSNLVLITNCKSKVDLCLKDHLRCQKQITNLELKLQNLDLPHDIEQATKQVAKITEDIARLSRQIHLTPNTKVRYQREFLPLSSALANLRVQSRALEIEPNQNTLPHASTVQPSI